MLSKSSIDNSLRRETWRWAVSAAALLAAGGLAWGQDAMTGEGEAGQPEQPSAEQPTEQPGEQPDEQITLSGFSGPVDLTALLEFAVDELEINLWVDPSLNGQTVTLNAPITFPKSELLYVLNTILEGNGFAITPSGVPNVYRVRPSGEVGVTFGEDLATTRIVQTPNIRPSALKPMLDSQFGVAAGGAAVPKIAYLDDAGFMVVTGTPTTIRWVESLVSSVLEQRAEERFFRIELTYIGSTAAIEQATRLAGFRVGPIAGQAQPAELSAGTLGNLKERLTVSTQGNALIFRGRPGELAEVEALIELIDVAIELESEKYFTGSQTLAIAELASKQGLGDVVRLSAGTQIEQLVRSRQAQQLGLESRSSMGGAKLVVAEERGWVYYSGTAEQQARFARLVEEFRAEDELSVVEVYKVHHSDVEVVAEIIGALIEGALPAGQSPLLPQGQPGAQRTPSGNQFDPPEPEGEEEEGAFNPGPDVFVIADVDNNQLIVRAPKKQQREFERLIERLDLRRPQVYLEAQIVAVNATEDFRLRFESQLISGQFAFSSLFGLSTGGDSITDPVTVPGGLLGGTAAVIKSQYVPFIIQALQTNVDGRILASPRLLVNDNDTTTIVNVDRFPVSTLSQGANTTLTSFAGEQVEAGTTFTVRPRISSGDYINLEYDIELSSFTGPPPVEGAPPPSRKTSISGGSVTVPGGSTIVVGGLTFENTADTVVKIPFLGDIPLIGLLFRDTQKSTQRTTIYMFITPHILRDPTFRDIAVLTRGPQAEMEIPPDVPALEPVMMRLHTGPVRGDSGTVRRREGER